MMRSTSGSRKTIRLNSKWLWRSHPAKRIQPSMELFRYNSKTQFLSSYPSWVSARFQTWAVWKSWKTKAISSWLRSQPKRALDCLPSHSKTSPTLAAISNSKQSQARTCHSEPMTSAALILWYVPQTRLSSWCCNWRWIPTMMVQSRRQTLFARSWCWRSETRLFTSATQSKSMCMSQRMDQVWVDCPMLIYFPHKVVDSPSYSIWNGSVEVIIL